MTPELQPREDGATGERTRVRPEPIPLEPQAARRMLAAIVDSTNDAVVSKTTDGVIQTWNAGAEHLFGYSAEEAVGRHIALIIPPDRLDEENAISARIRAGSRVEHFETVRVHRDGHEVQVSLTISPIRDESGAIVGASKIARDIQGQKRAEERILALLTEMKESNRLKDEFLAMLAHELRNPLAALSHALTIARRSDNDDAVLEQARRIMERQLTHLVRLVDDLIDVGRITRGRMELKRQPIELWSILEQSIEVCRPLIERLCLHVELSVPPEPVYLDADAVRLAQAFGNIVNNACKFSELEGRITVTAERAGPDVVVRVRDYGIGMPPDQLDAVFEPFAQLDRTLERARGGLGVGLTLARRLVEMQGGRIFARSDGLGSGSEFSVRLPVLVYGMEERREEPKMTTEAPPRRILIVDDNPDAASSLSTLLRISGHETHVAHDGVAAVAAAEEFRPDVILLDVGLPKMNGYDVCREIRSRDWGRPMMIVAMTGWGQDDDRRRSKEAGFDRHMVKPINYDDLMSLLASPLESRATIRD